MKRRFGHWSMRYFRDKIAYMRYCRRHPDVPWVTPTAVDFLDEWLSPEDIGIEWGSGRSTAWLAGRVGKLVSVEHQASWHAKVSSDLAGRDIRNVEYVLAEVASESEGSAEHPYVAAGRQTPAGEVSFALVDGVLRDHCARLAMELLKPGGLLIVDDAHRYLPHASRSPYALGKQGRPPSPVWQDIHKKLCSWRRFWTSNGIKDTVMFVRPCG